MSAKSSKLEKDVASYINQYSEIHATRPKASSSFADVWLDKENCPPCWLEVKMDHGNNLANPRVFYNGIWRTTYKTIAATTAVQILNELRAARQFIQSLSAFTNIPQEIIKIQTNLAQFRNDPGLVTIDVLTEYCKMVASNRYIVSVDSVDLGTMITNDYNKKNVHYMQAGDEFYQVGYENPLHLPDDIPQFEGEGDFKVRVATRSAFSEVLAELKLYKFPKSPYSCKPGTSKLNPFRV